MNNVQYLTITEDSAGQRVDNFLIGFLKGVPKSHIYRIIRKGEVRVNKKRVKAVNRLQIDDVVRVPPVRVADKSEADGAVNLNKVQHLEQQIVYESERLIVLNKPSGMAVHGGSGLSFGVIEAMRKLRPDQRFLELVHRIDRDTSGCLLIAKKRSCLRYLHEQLREKTLYKEYIALAQGHWPKGTRHVDAPLEKNQLKSGERMVRVGKDGKPSRTDFSVERRFVNTTLVKASPLTGRTHQIRVHAQFVGCPLVGDSKYGEAEFNKQVKSDFRFNRLFLHARRLSFKEQEDGKVIHVQADYDPALKQLLDKLSKESFLESPDK